MKKQKENNNLYVENPTVGYQDSQEQPSYDRKVEIYNKKEEPSYEREEPYKKDEDLYEDDEEPYDEEKEIIFEKENEKAKQARTYGNPLLVAGILYAIWPLGLYWMWKYKVYNKIARIILSILIPIYGASKLIGYFTN
ncbi:hypothetical protein [Clostridium sp.]